MQLDLYSNLILNVLTCALFFLLISLYIFITELKSQSLHVAMDHCVMIEGVMFIQKKCTAFLRYSVYKVVF